MVENVYHTELNYSWMTISFLALHFPIFCEAMVQLENGIHFVFLGVIYNLSSSPSSFSVHYN